MRALAALAILLAAPAAASLAADDVVLPSGQTVTLQETLRDTAGPAGLTDRFRFLAPWLAGVAYEDIAPDIQWLCDTVALPRVASSVPPPVQVVLSVSDRPVPFGASDPDATQFFESFTVTDGTCVVELF
ncbi:MAG: DUF6497 family protein [Rhodobacteraceae bacterium]|nr:DUF6497 family protein [Paracoccaceae bacterium]